MVESAHVTVLGLGSMGARIATVLAGQGICVVGWNRSPGRAYELVDSGVRVERDLSHAVRDTSLVIAVPMTYDNTREALAPMAASGLLAGKVLLNLSWGSLDDAQEMSAWCEDAGCGYLDGSLLCYPDEIGTHAGRVVYSGSRPAADATAATISILGSVQYLGENVSAANAVGTAAGMMFYHSALAAFYEAIAFAARYDVAPSALLPEIRVMLDLLSAHFAKDIERIESDDFANPSASIDVHLDGVRITIDQLAAMGQSSPLMHGFAELVQPLADAGFGNQSIARLFNHLRTQAPSVTSHREGAR